MNSVTSNAYICSYWNIYYHSLLYTYYVIRFTWIRDNERLYWKGMPLEFLSLSVLLHAKGLYVYSALHVKYPRVNIVTAQVSGFRFLIHDIEVGANRVHENWMLLLFIYIHTHRYFEEIFMFYQWQQYSLTTEVWSCSIILIWSEVRTHEAAFGML